MTTPAAPAAPTASIRATASDCAAPSNLGLLSAAYARYVAARRARYATDRPTSVDLPFMHTRANMFEHALRFAQWPEDVPYAMSGWELAVVGARAPRVRITTLRDGTPLAVTIHLDELDDLRAAVKKCRGAARSAGTSLDALLTHLRMILIRDAPLSERYLVAVPYDR
jgi:hypothetical protein